MLDAYLIVFLFFNTYHLRHLLSKRYSVKYCYSFFFTYSIAYLFYVSHLGRDPFDKCNTRLALSTMQATHYIRIIHMP